MKKVIKVLATTTLLLTLALPITSYASQWAQDEQGWRVQSDDGVYLTNQWYQSPESGLYYYMGVDGYMLANTVTPDGFQVGADGAWIPTDSSTNSTALNKPINPETTSNNVADAAITDVNNNSDSNTNGYYIQPEIDFSQYDPEDMGGIGRGSGNGYNFNSY